MIEVALATPRSTIKKGVVFLSCSRVGDDGNIGIVLFVEFGLWILFFTDNPNPVGVGSLDTFHFFYSFDFCKLKSKTAVMQYLQSLPE